MSSVQLTLKQIRSYIDPNEYLWLEVCELALEDLREQVASIYEQARARGEVPTREHDEPAWELMDQLHTTLSTATKDKLIRRRFYKIMKWLWIGSLIACIAGAVTIACLGSPLGVFFCVAGLIPIWQYNGLRQALARNKVVLQVIQQMKFHVDDCYRVMVQGKKPIIREDHQPFVH